MFLKDALWPHWKGHYQVLLTNPYAAKLKGIDPWIHVSPLKKTPALVWTSQPTKVLKLKLSKKTSWLMANMDVEQITYVVDGYPKIWDQASFY